MSNNDKGIPAASLPEQPQAPTGPVGGEDEEKPQHLREEVVGTPITQENINEMRASEEASYRLSFMDSAAVELMPLACQLSTQQKPNLDPRKQTLDINVIGAATLAYQFAAALWAVREKVASGQLNAAPQAAKPN